MRLSDIVDRERCYVTRVWGFTPESWGALGFPNEGTTDKWLARGANLFVVWFVSHNPAEHIADEDVGRVLGVYELIPEKVDLENDGVIEAFHLEDPMLRNDNNRLKWPTGLRAKRAWRFVGNIPLTRETLPSARKRSYDVSTDMVLMAESDFALLDNPAYVLKEVPVYPEVNTDARWTDPNAKPNSVYMFSCANQNMLKRLPKWKEGLVLVKIGCTENVERRLSEFNDDPLSRIFGLKLSKVYSEYVGEAHALRREAELLRDARKLGSSASEIPTEFVFMNPDKFLEWQMELVKPRHVA